VVKALVAALCCVIVLSCASSRPRALESKPDTTRNESVLPGSKQDQIKQLEEAINVDRLKLALDEPPESDYATSPAEPMGAMPSTQDPKCRPAKNETCSTSCTLSDSICGNADKICKLAIEINDDWARGRCAKANKTCEGSRTKCCGCQ